MKAEVVLHMDLPGMLRRHAERRPDETIAQFLRRTKWAVKHKDTGWQFSKLPTICVINGQPVLQSEWKRRRMSESDHVVFYSKPRGGGGGGKNKSVFGLLAIIGLSLLAPGIAGALLPASIAEASLFGVTGARLLAGALPIGGELLQLRMIRLNFLSSTPH